MRQELSRLLLSQILVSAMLLLCLSGTSSHAGETQAASNVDLVLGTWILDVEQSKFSPGPAPKSQKRTYQSHLDGVETSIETVGADGKLATIRYVADYDSLEYQLTGSSRVDTIQLKRVNDRVAEATLRHARKELGTARRTISEDGNSMTISFRGKDTDGRAINNVAVYKREQ